MPPKKTTNTKSNVHTPEGTGVRIDDVNKSLWRYIRKYKLRELLLVALTAIIWEVLLIFFTVKFTQKTSDQTNNVGQIFASLYIVPFIVLSPWLYKIKKQFEDAFLEEFAADNGFSFSKTGTVDEAYGTIFRINSRQKVSDIVSGNYAGSSLRLFLYELTTGSGRSSQTFNNTIIEVDLHGKLPSLLLIAKKSAGWMPDLAGSFGTKNTFNLEGDFNDSFKLYGNAQNKIEALEVFSPDIMEIIKERDEGYDIEFSGNRIYIYIGTFISNSDELAHVFTLTKKLIDKISPLAARLEYDSDIPAPVSVSRPLETNSFSLKVITVITILVFAGGTAITGILVDHIQSMQQNAETSRSASIPPLPTSADVSEVVGLGNQFTADLAKGDIQSAQLLESSQLQQDNNHMKFLEDYKAFWTGFANTKLVGQKTGLKNDAPWVGLVYENDSLNSPYYMKLIFFNDGTGWRVWIFQSLDTLPAAAPN